MAEEKFKDKAPPASDDWKPIGGKRAKPFGVHITYGPAWRGQFYEWTHWYPTKRAQEEAIRAVLKKNDGARHSYRVPFTKAAKYTATPIER